MPNFVPTTNPYSLLLRVNQTNSSHCHVVFCANFCPAVATPRKLLISRVANICKQGVKGSNPLTSTNHLPAISITC